MCEGLYSRLPVPEWHRWKRPWASHFPSCIVYHFGELARATGARNSTGIPSTFSCFPRRLQMIDSGASPHIAYQIYAGKVLRGWRTVPVRLRMNRHQSARIRPPLLFFHAVLSCRLLMCKVAICFGPFLRQGQAYLDILVVKNTY